MCDFFFFFFFFLVEINIFCSKIDNFAENMEIVGSRQNFATILV